jgi:acyl-CoA reductase-like NAD-dependent aldehyde dehydrogenase
MEPAKFLIDGVWTASEVVRPVLNPYTGNVVGQVCQATPADIESAIVAAVAAFQKTRMLSSYERWEALTAIAAGIQSSKDEFASLMTAETGKPITFSRVEVERAIFTFTVAAEEAKRIEGEVLPLDLAPRSGERIAVVRRFPLGPIAAITPFNFPLNLVAHKLGPAIAAGCSVVLKPSSKAPLTALKLAEIIDRTSLPKGILNLVPCLSSEGEQLTTDKRLKLITFTGSPAVGWPIKARAGKKRVVLELGGNAGVIVDKDADVSFAMKRVVQGAFGNAGQSCISVQRIFVHESMYDKFVDQLVKVTKSVAAGDPLNERTIVGPMIDEQAASKVEGWIFEALAQGATLLCGGRRTGAFLEPTVLTDVQPGMKVCAQEVFAPVVTVEPFKEFRDAVIKVNASDYGLQAGVFTNNLDHVLYAFRELEVGGVIINDASSYRMDHMPYGGVKDSGFGREGLKYAIEEMTEMKLLALSVS